MSTLREAAQDWASRALAEENPSADTWERAESLLAIAEANSIPIEDLITWIRTPSPGKQYSAAEFRGFCVAYVADRAFLLQLSDNDEWRKLCPQCHKEVAHRVASVWRCPRCGELPAEGAKG
jgi:peptide subunit release factor 1 (eRF1)